MPRSLLLLLLALLAGASLVSGTYQVARWACASRLAGPGDDLAWLRREFRLQEADLARIRRLHQGYLPQCRDLCQRIAVQQQQLQAAWATGQGVTPTVEQKLAAIAALRLQCQTQMLRHFYAVSLAMPPAQGRRYLAQMQRLTLGFHDQFERSMAPASPSAHGHH